MRAHCLLPLLLLPATTALLLPNAALRLPAAPRAPIIRCALDYKDPVVAEEFGLVQGMDYEEVEEEITSAGIPVPPTMNEMDVRLMLVEMRMRKAGKVGAAAAAPKKPASYGSDFEKFLWEKPAFKELIDSLKSSGDTNALNLATEYVNNQARAKERYGGTERYEATVAQLEEALNAKVVREVRSGKLMFSGFPANMGEAGIRMAFEAFGPLAELSVEESDDGISCSGRAEFEETDAAQAAVDKYDGMDMGLGTTLELQPL